MPKLLNLFMIKSPGIMLLIKRKIQWTDECQEAFDTLKVLCNSALILVFADFSELFELLTDASAIVLGTVLYQEQDGKDRVIRYASRVLFHLLQPPPK